MTQKNLSVRLVMEGGKEVVAQLIGIESTAKTSLGRFSAAADDVGKSTGAMRSNVQNAAFQVQDFFVQVSSGTSVSRALGQQLPQLLGSMGLLGVLAGTGAAALIPLASVLFKTGDGVEALIKDLDALSTAIGHLKEFNADFSTAGVQKLIDKYGELDAAVMVMILHQREMAQNDALAAARKVVDDLKSSFMHLNALVAEYDNFAKAGGSDPEWLINAQSALDTLQSDLGLTIDQARAMQAAVADLDKAHTPAEMATAIAHVTELLQDSALKGTDLARALLTSEDNLRQLNVQGGSIDTWLSWAVSGAADFARNMWDAEAATRAAAAARLPAYSIWGAANHRAEVEQGLTGRIAALPGTMTPGGVHPQKSPAGIDGFDMTTTAHGGGGGGHSAVSERLQLAQKLYEETRTSAEKYAAEEAKINELMKSGAIDGDTYQRAIEMIGKKYGEAGDAASFFNDINGQIESSILDLAVSGEASFGKIADAIKRAAFEAMLFGDGPLGKMLGGPNGSGLLGGLFSGLFGGAGGGAGAPPPSFAGGGYTGTGSRSGGMDGHGGFMAMLHPHEIVTDLTRTQRAAQAPAAQGGALVQIIDQRQAGAAVETRRQAGPDGREIIVATIRDAETRGDLDRGKRARFGLRPTQVTR